MDKSGDWAPLLPTRSPIGATNGIESTFGSNGTFDLESASHQKSHLTQNYKPLQKAGRV
jgi:hypothetical protein